MRRFSFEMPYIKDLSVNHYLGKRRDGGYYVKPAVKAWMEELGWKIKSQHIEDWGLPLHVTCDGLFRDGRSAPDLSNLSKVVLDGIQETTGINDRDMRWHDGLRIITHSVDEPYLRITVEGQYETHTA
jgi:Holliday junction resolvase RusA-like endonuclease